MIVLVRLSGPGAGVVGAGDGPAIGLDTAGVFWNCQALAFLPMALLAVGQQLFVHCVAVLDHLMWDELAELGDDRFGFGSVFETQRPLKMS